MLNKNLELYKELYSKYIELAVDLHNYHQLFINNVSSQAGMSVRRSIRGMTRIEKQLHKLTKDVYKEFRANEKQARQEALAWKKANPLPRGRPKKEL